MGDLLADTGHPDAVITLLADLGSDAESSTTKAASEWAETPAEDVPPLHVLLEHKSPETVVVVGRDVGRAEEALTVTTLGELDPVAIDMKCLLIVGASSTRVSSAGVWTPRFVR